jgi:ferritin-like metal-binding protein YciE
MAAQAVEHYEIDRYGTLRTWVRQLGMDEAAPLFEAMLAEEINTDKTLSELAWEEATRRRPDVETHRWLRGPGQGPTPLAVPNGI